MEFSEKEMDCLYDILVQLTNHDQIVALKHAIHVLQECDSEENRKESTTPTI